MGFILLALFGATIFLLIIKAYTAKEVAKEKEKVNSALKWVIDDDVVTLLKQDMGVLENYTIYQSIAMVIAGTVLLYVAAVNKSWAIGILAILVEAGFAYIFIKMNKNKMTADAADAGLT